MERMTLRERQRQAREEAILDAAHELLMEQGYAAMSMDDLAARLCTSKATLYHHFPSKEELAISVIIRMMRRGEERLNAHDPALPAIVRLERSLRANLLDRAGMSEARITLLPQSVTHHPLYQAQRCRMVQALSALIEQAKAEGDVAPELPTPVAARLILNLFRIDFGDLVQSGEQTPEQVVGAVVELLLNGIRKPHPIHPQEEKA
jgi:AcrR family transcriptional regulator